MNFNEKFAFVHSQGSIHINIETTISGSRWVFGNWILENLQVVNKKNDRIRGAGNLCFHNGFGANFGLGD